MLQGNDWSGLSKNLNLETLETPGRMVACGVGTLSEAVVRRIGKRTRGWGAGSGVRDWK